MSATLQLLLLLLVSSFHGPSRAHRETLCTASACFTLHTDQVTFSAANQSCFHNGGYLTTVRDAGEEDVLRSLLAHVPRRGRGRGWGQDQDGGRGRDRDRGRDQDRDQVWRFWIGLKLHRGDCVLPHRVLRGFRWVSGDPESLYSNWDPEPVDTCTERCVGVTHRLSGENPLGWSAGACRSPAAYVCKFYFRGMCSALTLLGRGHVTYTAPFSEEPLRSGMTSVPLGTYAKVSCQDGESHYSVCAGADGAYRWTAPGPFCPADKDTCASSNGGCEQVCRQDADQLRCSCNPGFDLQEDGRSCRPSDPCAANACEQLCVPGEEGSSCRCPDGFQLDADQHLCADVDECRSQSCRGRRCVNTHGSYRCECFDGFVARADGSCSDVDECVRSECDHGCSNAAGSFSCYCDRGFALSDDGRTCVDVDECDSGPCPFLCVNTPGGFSCTCPPGLRPDATGTTCTPDETAGPLADPDGGKPGHNVTAPPPRATFRPPLTHTPPLNATQDDRRGNTSTTTSSAAAVDVRVLICVLGSGVPLLLVTVTLAIAAYRCHRSREEAEKTAASDGYCWVSSGLDPRLEKLYASVRTDDL